LAEQVRREQFLRLIDQQVDLVRQIDQHQFLRRILVEQVLHDRCAKPAGRAE
jgi:hypothetical protein